MKNVSYLSAQAKRYSFSTINCSTTKSGEFVFDLVRVKRTTGPRTGIEREKGIDKLVCSTFSYSRFKIRNVCSLFIVLCSLWLNSHFKSICGIYILI